MCVAGALVLLHPPAVVPEGSTLLAEMLRMLLALVGHVQAVWLLQGALFVRIHFDVALDAFLTHVGPAVSTHPLPLAFGALVFAEAALLSLVRSEAFSFRSCLWTVPDVVSFSEAKVTEVVWRRPLGDLLIWA